MYPDEKQREERKKQLETIMYELAIKRLKASSKEDQRIQLIHERAQLEHKILQNIDRLQKMIEEYKLP